MIKKTRTYIFQKRTPKWAFWDTTLVMIKEKQTTNHQVGRGSTKDKQGCKNQPGTHYRGRGAINTTTWGNTLVCCSKAERECLLCPSNLIFRYTLMSKFLYLSTIDIWGQIILCCRGRCSVPRCQKPPPHLWPPKMSADTTNVLGVVGEGGEENCPDLRTTSLI